MILSHRALSSLNLREFVKTSVILTPGALLVGCEPQFVLHFRGDLQDPGDPGDPMRCPKIVF